MKEKFPELSQDCCTENIRMRKVQLRNLEFLYRTDVKKSIKILKSLERNKNIILHERWVTAIFLESQPGKKR